MSESRPATTHGSGFALTGIVVEPAANQLVADDGTRTRLEARAMDVLVLLHRRAGEVVSSREILDAVWGDAAVSAHSVAIVISDLRRALGDDARAPRLIETVPKRGYRLITGRVAAPAAAEASAVASRGPLSKTGTALVLALGVGVAVVGARLRARTDAPLDPELARRYEQARDLWSRREQEGAVAARRLLDEILAARADFAPAHAAMADLYVHKTGEYLGVAPLEAFRVGQWHADRAIDLDPNQPDAHVSLALLAFYRDRQPRKALAALDRALKLDPNLARAWQAKGMVLSSIGEPEASLEAIQRARELDPVSPSAAWDEVWFLYLAGRFDAALESAERASGYSPRNYFYEALIEEGRGRPERAFDLWLERLEQGAVALPGAREMRALAAAGRLRDAYRELVRQRLALAGPREWETVLAIWQLLSGDADTAARTVAAAHAGENWTWIWFAQMPIFTRLAERNDVRELLAQSNAPPSAPERPQREPAPSGGVE